MYFLKLDSTLSFVFFFNAQVYKQACKRKPCFNPLLKHNHVYAQLLSPHQHSPIVLPYHVLFNLPI